MLQFVRDSGPYGIVLSLLAVAQLAVAARAVARLRRDRGPAAADAVNAVLFWGGIAAVLGCLGQHHGMYKGLSAVAQAAEISPQVVAQGWAQSIASTILGLGILLVSALVWAALRWRLEAARRRPS